MEPNTASIDSTTASLSNSIANSNYSLFSNASAKSLIDPFNNYQLIDTSLARIEHEINTKISNTANSTTLLTPLQKTHEQGIKE